MFISILLFLTVPETRDLIKQIKAKYLKSEKYESKEVKSVIQKINALSSASLADASNEQLKEFKALLQQKLAEIDKVLVY